MKKLLVLLAGISALLSSNLYSQQHQDAIQIFMPKTVFVGDTAELRYIFQTEADLFADRTLNHIDLIADYPALQTTKVDREQRCTILHASIDRTGAEYTLVLTLVPWKAGELDFLPFDLAQWIRLSLKKNQHGASYELDFSPVFIHSLVQQIKATTLRPSAAPLVVPGTTAILVVLGVLFLIAFTVFVVFLLHIGALSQMLRLSGATRYMHKQARIALKQLKQLEKSMAKHAVDMRTFASTLQHILRTYLTHRFMHDFAPLTTPILASECIQLLGGEITETEQQAVDTLSSLFLRTDYIRFAHTDEADLSEQAALLQKTADCIRLFDTERT